MAPIEITRIGTRDEDYRPDQYDAIPTADGRIQITRSRRTDGLMVGTVLDERAFDGLIRAGAAELSISIEDEAATLVPWLRNT